MGEKLENFKEEIEKGLEKNEKLTKLTVFVSKMFLLGILFQTILLLNPNFRFFQELLAEIIKQLINIGPAEYTRNGIALISKGNNYLITRDCLGWKSIAVFSALIFATPKRKKLKIFVGGIITLILANIIRIISTIILAENRIISFDIIHNLLWKWGMTGIVLIIWYVWWEEPFHWSKIKESLNTGIENSVV